MFDVTKYKDSIMTAARCAGVLIVSINKKSLTGEIDPTFYLGCISFDKQDEIEEAFILSLCETVNEDINWNAVMRSDNVVREKSGILLISNGEWCYSGEVSDV